MASTIEHPHIERRPGFRGGNPILRGTSFPVTAVVVYVLRHGMTPEELVDTFPHLTLAQIYDALSYYYDHRDAMDPLVAARVGEDDFARTLPAGDAVLLRYNREKDAFEVEHPFRAPSKIAEG